MDDTRTRLLRGLGQPGFATGTRLGAALGLSRAAVHKHVQALAAQGLPVRGVPGRGYRLADGVSLLDATILRERLGAPARALLGGLDILDEVDSTNAWLAQRRERGALHGRVCLAERQSAGRGRRGRLWCAVPYRDVMMSIGVEYPQWPAQLPTLGLVTALMVSEALAALGAAGLTVKWPNDIVHADGKLCGVLLDVSGEAHGPCRVIVGIGINVSSDAARPRDIDQPWTDLVAVSGQPVDRNTLVARCLDYLLPALQEFPATGFLPYRSLWRRRGDLRGHEVRIHSADGVTHLGRAVGVDESGRLRLVGADGHCRLFSQGDVSARRR